MKIGYRTKLNLLNRSITAIAIVLLAGGTVRADETFAQYIEADGSVEQWSLSTDANNVTTLTASGQVYFSFSGIAGLPFSGPQLATFSLNASSSDAGSCSVSCGPGDAFMQFGYSGTFSITDTALSAGFQNLLSGTFAVTGSPSTTGAQYGANIGSSSGNFTASATPGNLSQVILTSSYLNFTDQTEETASFALSSLIPSFSTGPVTTGTSGSTTYPSVVGSPFISSGAGTFSSNPGPVSSAPEPATLGLVGGVLLGIGLWRRKTLLRTAPAPATNS